MSTKFLEYLAEAQKIVSIIDHMFFVSYPLVQDKKILIKVITESKKAIANCINAILQYEYLFKRITLYQDPHLNMRTFTLKSAPRYSISDSEIQLINELFEIVKLHEQSPMTFTRQEKIVILSDDMRPKIITIEKAREFLLLSKNILQKTKQNIKNW